MNWRDFFFGKCRIESEFNDHIIKSNKDKEFFGIDIDEGLG